MAKADRPNGVTTISSLLQSPSALEYISGNDNAPAQILNFQNFSRRPDGRRLGSGDVRQCGGVGDQKRNPNVARS